MATGPCLCGDSYCPNCGDPAAAEFADAVVDFSEWIEENVETPAEFVVMAAAAKAASQAFRDQIRGYTPNDIVGELQREIADLKFDLSERAGGIIGD